MNSTELKSALEAIAATTPIPTQFNCAGERSIRDKFPTVKQMPNGDVLVIVDVDFTTNVEAASKVLVGIRARLAEIDPRFRYTKKAHRDGFWNLGRFVTTSLSRRFLAGAE